MEYIKSTANTRVKFVSGLKSSANRRENGLFIVEGVRLVTDAPLTPVEVYVTEEHRDIGERFEQICPTYLVSREAFEKMSDTKTPQGVLAVFSIADRGLKSPQSNYAIVLDGVSDPGNVGTIIRTAGATGFSDVYLVNCADPYSPKVVRSSMGGVFRTRVSEGEIDGVFKVLKENNFSIYSLDMGGENLFKANTQKPCALVVGSEATGVSEYTRKHADGVLALPMVNDTESLNAGVSASTAMYILKFKE